MAIIFFMISVVIIGIDQWVKYLTVSSLQLGETKEFISGFLSFTYVRNTGAAWSVLEGQMWFFYLITIPVLLVVSYLIIKHANKKQSRWFSVGLALVLAGAAGNFIDRVRLGYVVDMFQTEFMNFPIFNVADMSLVIGVACIFIHLIMEEKREKDKKNAAN